MLAPLLLCLVLLATCSHARPNWSPGLLKIASLPREPLINYNSATKNIETINKQGTIQHSRSIRQLQNPRSFGASFSLGINTSPLDLRSPQWQVPNQHGFGAPLGPPLHVPFGSPNHQSLGSRIASKIQNIIGTHLESTVQQNLAAHYGTLQEHNFYPPPPPCLLCGSFPHPLGETSHHIDIDTPQIIASGVHVEITSTGDAQDCHDSREGFPPSTERALPQSTKIVPVTPSSVITQTTTKGSDIVYESDLKDVKTFGQDESDYDIDIRFGSESSRDDLPSKN